MGGKTATQRQTKRPGSERQRERKKRHTGEDLKKDNPKLSKIILSSSEEKKIYLINW